MVDERLQSVQSASKASSEVAPSAFQDVNRQPVPTFFAPEPSVESPPSAFMATFVPLSKMVHNLAYTCWLRISACVLIPRDNIAGPFHEPVLSPLIATARFPG